MTSVTSASNIVEARNSNLMPWLTTESQRIPRTHQMRFSREVSQEKDTQKIECI